MTDSNALVAVGILLGGASRRMGTPKHEITLPDDSTLLDHVVGVAESVCDNIVLCGGEPIAQAHPQLGDRPGCAGPLAGIDALLRHVRRGRCLILPCDMPALRPDDLHRLAAAEAELAIFDAPRGEPTCSRRSNLRWPTRPGRCGRSSDPSRTSGSRHRPIRTRWSI